MRSIEYSREARRTLKAMPKNVSRRMQSKIEALADAAGVSKPCVSRIEGGKRAGTAATMKKLAGALGVPMEALLS